MTSATPMPSIPRSRKSVPATSKILSRWAAACSRVTLTGALLSRTHLTLYMMSVINTIHDGHHRHAPAPGAHLDRHTLSSTRRSLESMKEQPMTNSHSSTFLDPRSSADSAARADRELNAAIV